MKLSTKTLAFLSTLASAACNAERMLEGDVHSCACEAEEFNFKIDCADTAAMLDSMQYLKANGCATTCTEEDAPECFRNYLIVQTHHDYCPEEGVPQEIEDGFHDFDTACSGCGISRKSTEGAADCPAHTCEVGRGNDAYVALIEGGCLTDCSSETCKEKFLILRVEHDECAHETISTAAEDGIHDLEEACLIKCNIDGVDNQLVCVDDQDDHDDHDDHDEAADGAKMGDGTSPAAGRACAVASMLVVAVGSMIIA